MMTYWSSTKSILVSLCYSSILESTHSVLSLIELPEIKEVVKLVDVQVRTSYTHLLDTVCMQRRLDMHRQYVICMSRTCTVTNIWEQLVFNSQALLHCQKIALGTEVSELS